MINMNLNDNVSRNIIKHKIHKLFLGSDTFHQYTFSYHTNNKYDNTNDFRENFFIHPRKYLGKLCLQTTTHFWLPKGGTSDSIQFDRTKIILSFSKVLVSHTYHIS